MKDVVTGGTYRHSKTGNEYIVRGIGIHTETSEEYVIYERVGLSSAHHGRIWLRPVEMFCEKVELNGKLVPRFELVK